MARPRIQSPRLADLIAGVLRERILSGELKDGETLARQEDLIEEFNVSPPSMREALRILESEGLITIQRGNVGGAIVHSAPVHTAAYTMAMVLQARSVDLTDVGSALQALEPVCAAMCASRPDRNETLVPELRAIQAETIVAAHDLQLVSHHARRFHVAIVEGCGSDTMIVLVGALEVVWTAHAAGLAEMATHPGELPNRDQLFSPEALRRYARDHELLIDAIERGDAAEAARISTEHQKVAAAPPSAANDQQVRASALRRGMQLPGSPSPGPRTI
jgi:DNA-binding FadR family transcriptional regulator